MEPGEKAEDFEARWAASTESLAIPPLPSGAQARRMELWRAQEWHGWFRWRLCRQGFDWSKPIWLATLSGGLLALIVYGWRSGRLDITAGGVVAWFTLVNLGFFSYLGLTHRPPPRPIPGPFPPGQTVRASMGLYPPGYDGRKLARLWLRVKVSGSVDEVLELSCPRGLPSELEVLCRRQTTFRMQRGDAPLTRAVCETVALSREDVDAGAHPLRIVTWRWDEQSTAVFGRPKG